jgi:hypothetical protein
MSGDLDQLLAVEHPTAGGGDEGIRIMGLGLAGRRDEAITFVETVRERLRLPAFQVWGRYLMAWLRRDVDEMLAHMRELGTYKVQNDPEAIFLQGWMACDVGQYEIGLEYVQRAVARGYSAAPTLASSRHFDALRGSPVFMSTLADAEAGRRHALVAFREAGGSRLLGRGGGAQSKSPGAISPDQP